MMNLIVADIDGVCAQFPKEAISLLVDNPNECRDCQDFNSDLTCKRPATCPKIGSKARESVNKIFSSENIGNFKHNEDVRTILINAKWSPTQDKKPHILIYVSGRPGHLLMPTINWLTRKNFPIGSVCLLGDLPNDPAENKANFLERILNNSDGEIDFVLFLEDDPKTISLYQDRFGAINLMG